MCDVQDRSCPGEADKKEKKRKRWMTALLVILGIMALPVLVPVGIMVVGGILLLLLMLAGGIISALLLAAGGLLTVLLCLGGMLAVALLGLGFGVVILFQAPASGMAILGVSLTAGGLCVIGGLISWELLKLCLKGCWKLFCWIRSLFGNRKKRKAGEVTGDEK